MLQDYVEREVLGEVNGVQQSLNAFGEMAMFLLGLGLREMRYFSWLMVMSCLCISTAWTVYVVFVVQKNHLWRQHG